MRDSNFVAAKLQEHCHALGGVSIVVDDQNAKSWRCNSFDLARHLGCGGILQAFCNPWQMDDEFTSFATAGAERLDRSAMQRNQSPGERQADAKAALSSLSHF